MRGKAAVKRKLKPDIRYSSAVVAKFINYLMYSGKKSVAEKVVYDCFEAIAKKIEEGKINKAEYPTPLAVFDQAIKNITPQMEVRSKRIGGGNYQIPFPVRGERKHFLALHWLLNAARNKKGKPMSDRLLDEIVAALNNEGDAIRKKMDVHRMADANRAFAHFAKYS